MSFTNLGYDDTGAYWRNSYESDTFQTDVEDLLGQLAPLYENLHTYIRRELSKQYGSHNFPESGHIPAHILGKIVFQKCGIIIISVDILILYCEHDAYFQTSLLSFLVQ